MTRHLLILAGVFLFSSIFTGCVTTPPKAATNDDLQKKYDTLDKDYNNLQSRDNDLVKNIQDLNKAINDKDNQIATLNKQIDDLKKSTKDLMDSAAKKGGLEAEIANLTKERNDLSQKVSELTGKLNDTEQQIASENKKMSDLEADLKKELSSLIANGNAEVYIYQGVLIVNVNDLILFDPDSPVLKDGFKKTLVDLAAIFKKAPEKILRIEGHTADVPVSAWPSSWDLGAMRAVNVVRFLQDNAAFDPQHIVAVSCGRFRPIAPNDTEENRKKNRRVEMVLIDRQLYEIKDLQKISTQ